MSNKAVIYTRVSSTGDRQNTALKGEPYGEDAATVLGLGTEIERKTVVCLEPLKVFQQIGRLAVKEK